MTTYERSGEKGKLKREYFNLIKQCDEFGYLDEVSFSIKLDSKRISIKTIKAIVFYYYKDN